ncbi:MAG: CaiB/BaiF CoA transferase family protein [Candidatus Methylomirabilia bacterium]
MLDDLRIISFCHFLQGPACTQYLADMGADVVKVEPPSGAFERHWAGAGKASVGGVSAFFLCANRNKRSLAIDLKHPDSREIIFRLVDRSHVVVENFRPGVIDRLGFGYDDIASRKPNIIYASATGFGASGPLRDRPGQDLLVQAMSGLTAASGNAERRPTPAGCAIVDQHGAALLAMGIVAAYVKLLRTGKGTRIETNLLSAGIDLQTEPLTLYFTRRPGREIFRREEELATWYHEAPYGVYRLADGFVAVSLNDPVKLAAALDSARLTELQTLDTYEERDRYAHALAGELRGRRFADLTGPFNAHGIWYARVDDYEDVRRNPQVVHNEAFREVRIGDGTATLVNHPLRYDGRTPGFGRFALRVGEHSREILAHLDYAQSEIDGLLERGVVVDSGKTLNP